MTLFALILLIVFVLLAVSIHLGAMRWIHALLPQWNRLNRFRVGVLVLVAIIANLLKIAVFALGLGILQSLGDHGQLIGAYHPGFRNDFYYSAVAYTAIGFGDIMPLGSIRLFTAVEALTGLVLIAWTTSSIFLARRQYWEVDRPVQRHCWKLLGIDPIFGRRQNMPPTEPTPVPPLVYIGTRSSLYLTSATMMPA
jgi:hypothetical protein